MKNIVIFASGSGTNAENIILYFKNKNNAKVVAVFSNNQTAAIIDKANNLKVPTIVFSREQLKSEVFLQKIKGFRPDLIVLAGFLWQFPESIILSYKDKIINIHPSLLPKYGGKGMYGMNVHKAVLENKEAETGITIHYVNENYDEGKIIFQKSVAVDKCKTPEEIAAKIHELEMDNFPHVIDQLLTSNL